MRTAGRCVRVLATGLLASVAALAHAGERPYERQAFERMLAERSPLVVVIAVDWCATCTLQQIAVRELLQEPRFDALTVMVADFEKDRELNRRLRVVVQGTMVVFKGGKEVARATGETRKPAIAALFGKAL